MQRPLDGVTVVTLKHAIAAPFCTRQLADRGARVIKVERPRQRRLRARLRRARQRHGFAIRPDQSPRGKPGLDVKHPAAQKVLEKLLEEAHVLVQNFAPGAAARLGLSFEALHEKRTPG